MVRRSPHRTLAIAGRAALAAALAVSFPHPAAGGETVPPLEVDLLDNPDAVRIDGEEIGDRTGVQIAACDINGDGMDDLVIGADYGSGPGNGRPYCGEVYIVYGRRGAWTGPIPIASVAAVHVIGQEVDDSLGYGVGCGDINGDGFGDAILCATYGDGPGNNRFAAGQAHILFGGPSLPAEIDLATDPGMVVYGARVEDQLCQKPAVGDINGDGIGDLILDSPASMDPTGTYSQVGRVDVLFGRAFWPDEVDLLAESDLTIWGGDSLDNLGGNLTAGDLNGDGVEELIAVANVGDGPDNQRPEAGDINVFWGRPDWPAVIHLDTEDPDLWVFGADEGDTAGAGGVAVGDMDGDGTPEMLISVGHGGGRGNDAPDTGECRAYQPGSSPPPVVDLGTDTDRIIYGADPKDSFGGPLRIGNLNGEGLPDLVNGASGADGPDESRPDSGEITVFFGRTPFPAELDVALADEDVLIFGPPDDSDWMNFNTLGDINGDGIDEIVATTATNSDTLLPSTWLISPLDNDRDGITNLPDNCPRVYNPGQRDSDGDLIGDACDPDLGHDPNDRDGDGTPDAADNCPDRWNPLQADGEGDGIGNACDLCPAVSDPGQEDTDGDGRGDACDCQPNDRGDLSPGEVAWLDVDRADAQTASLSWLPADGADGYSVSRGVLSGLATGSYGPCLAEGVQGTSYQDAETPPPGEGYFYLVQAQNFDCGLGPLGFGASEQERTNGDPAACAGYPHADVYPESEETIHGTVVAGSLSDVLASDNALEEIQEDLSSGNPSRRYSQLEHRWTVQVPASSRLEFHVEGLRTRSPDGDNFAFEYSADGGSTFNSIPVRPLGLKDFDTDFIADLPSSLSGTVIVRVVDTDHTEGAQDLDTVSLDELFVRSIP